MFRSFTYTNFFKEGCHSVHSFNKKVDTSVSTLKRYITRNNCKSLKIKTDDFLHTVKVLTTFFFAFSYTPPSDFCERFFPCAKL